MKLRQIALVLLMVGGFWFLLSHLGSEGNFGVFAKPDPSSLTLNVVNTEPKYLPEEENNINVYKRALPSVVNITSTSVGLNFFYGLVPQQGQGSGFILDKAGYILTNYHVIAGAQNIEVQTWDKHRYKATLVGGDRAHDLALLKIDAPNLQPAVLASSKNLQVGQQVYAIGNPFGLSGTMTSGIISAIRSVRGPTGVLIQNAIQTDAPINPGNSGGPLLNSQGEVIGINSMIATNPNNQVQVEQSAGIGFAIPIDTAKAVLLDLKRYGHAMRPTLGIETLPIGPYLAQQMNLPVNYGLLIERVFPGGPAAQAGLHGGNQIAYLGNQQIYIGGDLIVSMDGHQVTNQRDMSDIMDGLRPGETITITAYRGSRKMIFHVKLGVAGENGPEETAQNRVPAQSVVHAALYHVFHAGKS
ncbi:MAG: trypsin-like peptidase domain-containing protein [Acidobacteria bacterium]|jgi:S1-C subfamily serine protease|nr:trypsin-like peptidase domain-containing protein [Acidobacteriota bacterium]